MGREKERGVRALEDQEAVDKVVDIAGRRGPSPGPSLCVGRLLSWTAEGGAEVDYPDNPHGPLAALSLVAWSISEIAEIIADARPIALSFERGDSDRPIIMGEVFDPKLLAARSDAQIPPTEVVVDGEHVTVAGKERVELRCGKASITLTAEGKIMIRGTELTSRSTGSNRIRGGSIELN